MLTSGEFLRLIDSGQFARREKGRWQYAQRPSGFKIDWGSKCSAPVLAKLIAVEHPCGVQRTVPPQGTRILLRGRHIFNRSRRGVRSRFEIIPGKALPRSTAPTAACSQEVRIFALDTRSLEADNLNGKPFIAKVCR
jgi:hypothetical protein